MAKVAAIADTQVLSPILELFTRLHRAVGAWLERQLEVDRVTREMLAMSDAELADIGLCRGDIPAVATGRMTVMRSSVED